MSSQRATATGAQPPERMRGYFEVGFASLANGSIGVMVTYADMPATMLLCLRMAFAAAVLGLVVLATGSWRDLRKPGAPLRVLGISVALSLNLILYFLAIRYTGVAVAIFLSYLAPVYLAFVAPRILKEKTEPIVYVALAIGLAGMALILVPGLVLEGVKLSAAGLLYGWAAGVMYAVYLLFAKSLRGLNVRSTAVVFTQSAFTAAVMLVPGLLAVGAAHYQLHGHRSADGGSAGARHHGVQLQPVHGRSALHPRAAREHHRLRGAGERPVLRAALPRPGAELLDDRRRGADRRRGHPGRLYARGEPELEPLG